MHLSPWHMWGGSISQDLSITATPVDSATLRSQVARIGYGRPETWGFLFVVNVGTAPASPATILQLDVFFDLTVGLGRTQATLLGFGQITIGAAKIGGLSRWTTVVKAPEQNTFFPYTPDISRFPASDIQCSIRSRCFQNVGGDSLGQTVTIEATAMFSPQTHVRPEWNGTEAHNNWPRFPGGEDRGK